MIKRIVPIVILSALLIGCSLETVPGIAPADNRDVKVKTDFTTEEAGAPNQVKGTITSVTDGDTFKVNLSSDYIIESTQLTKGQEIIVRLLLIDTPESVGERAGMPFGDKASNFAKDFLEGKEVTLEFDKGAKLDKYGRFLSYAYVDGDRVQDVLVREGYAKIRYVAEPNTRYIDELRALEAKAREDQSGIWSIPDYVQIEEGFNEIGDYTKESKLIDDARHAAEDLSKEVVNEVVNSLFDSILSN